MHHARKLQNHYPNVTNATGEKIKKQIKTSVNFLPSAAFSTKQTDQVVLLSLASQILRRKFYYLKSNSYKG